MASEFSSVEVLRQFQLKTWLKCVAALGVANRYRSEAIATFHRLDRADRQPWRTYHNSDHIEACLVLCADWRSVMRTPAAVEVALWFHDAVYVSRRRDNERRSARWAEAVLRRWQVDEAVRSWVVSAILATQHQNPRHQDKASKYLAHNLPTDGGLDTDRALMLDIDLSIFAASRLEFTCYEAAIRREYGFVTDEAFRVGRLAVLRSFLERDRLFHSAIGVACFEARARENLTTAVDRLRSPADSPAHSPDRSSPPPVSHRLRDAAPRWP